MPTHRVATESTHPTRNACRIFCSIPTRGATPPRTRRSRRSSLATAAILSRDRQTGSRTRQPKYYGSDSTTRENPIFRWRQQRIATRRNGRRLKPKVVCLASENRVSTSGLTASALTRYLCTLPATQRVEIYMINYYHYLGTTGFNSFARQGAQYVPITSAAYVYDVPVQDFSYTSDVLLYVSNNRSATSPQRTTLTSANTNSGNGKDDDEVFATGNSITSSATVGQRCRRGGSDTQAYKDTDRQTHCRRTRYSRSLEIVQTKSVTAKDQQGTRQHLAPSPPIPSFFPIKTGRHGALIQATSETLWYEI